MHAGTCEWGREIAVVTAAAPIHRRGSDVPRRRQPMSRPRRPSQTPTSNFLTLAGALLPSNTTDPMRKPHFSRDAVLGPVCVGGICEGCLCVKASVVNSRRAAAAVDVTRAPYFCGNCGGGGSGRRKMNPSSA
ncbi:hypothetical protein NL676_039223 [Syzygium grande]|nr:hypothetical protein NL676_039223 [Syzygium grande]